MAVTVKITETYDMKTTVGKIGLVGVHTPQITLLRRLYPGLLKNHRFFRFVKCDVMGACASVLPADPLQVGVSAGEVAPEDMFNPILYTAVTNSSFDTIVARIRALSDVSSLASVEAGDMFRSSLSAENNFKVYYGMLAENGKWRKSMPQSGFMIKGLVPLCHTIVSTYGNVGSNMGNDNALGEDGETPVPIPDMDIPTIDDNLTVDVDGVKAVYLRGKSVKMPKFPCHVGVEDYDEIPYPSCPTTQVLALIIPPAKLHEFYYRLRITWYVRFENVISTTEIANYDAYTAISGASYGKNYTFSKSISNMENDADMVATDGVDINKVMES